MVPGDVLLHYRLIEPIGEGGMGQVWRATDTTLGRDVAIKFLPGAFAADPERLVRFEREAKLLASLNHPHIAAIYGFHEARGVRFLVMELVSGETIAERVARGRVPVEEARGIALAIASGLEYAHDHGVVHRDLKPANVKIAADGTVKVLDFGLAKAVAGDPSSAGPTSTPTSIPTVTSAETAAGIILGTAAYMSPEQARGKPIDRRTDIWAFGVVLYEMLAGHRLFDGETSSDTIAAVLTKPIDFEAPLAAAPRPMRQLLARCLTRDPKARLRDIGEARIALESPALEKAERAPRSWWPYALAGAVAGAVMTFAVHATIHNRGGSAGAPSIRATIDLPYQSTLISEDRGIALSPDGGQLALCVVDPASGSVSLNLRALGSLELRQVPGGAGCSYPFWSPDGKSLAFFGDGKLKRIDLADGIVRVLADAPAGRGGSWGSQGVIAFAPGAYGPIFQVSESGGTPTQLTKLFDPGESQRLPDYLPDGRRLLFASTVRADRAQCGVYLFDPGGEPRRLLQSKTEAVYVEPGFLAYIDDGNVMLRPVDPRRIEFTGAARPIASGARADFNRYFANLSLVPGGALVYQRMPPAKPGKLLWVDRDGRETSAPGTAGPMLGAVLSPDEKTVALSMLTEHGEYNVVQLDLDRGIGTPFGDPTHSTGGGAWSPDGRSFAYNSEQTGGGWQLSIAAATGQGTPVGLAGAGYEYEPGSFTADGRELLFARREGADKHSSVMIVGADGKSPPRPLVSRAESCGEPLLSPDARALAFWCEVGGRPELMVSSFPELGTIGRVSTDGVWRSQWGWTSAHELWWLDPSAHGWTAGIVPRANGPAIEPPKPLFGGKPIADSDFVPCYSRTRDRFFVVREDARAAMGSLIYVSDWRTALSAP